MKKNIKVTNYESYGVNYSIEISVKFENKTDFENCPQLNTKRKFKAFIKQVCESLKIDFDYNTHQLNDFSYCVELNSEKELKELLNIFKNWEILK